MKLTLPDLRTRPSNRSMMYTSSPGTTPSAICWSLIHLKTNKTKDFFKTQMRSFHLCSSKKAMKVSPDLSHSPGETVSALNLISLFSFDWATTDWARVSKSSYQVMKNRFDIPNEYERRIYFLFVSKIVTPIEGRDAAAFKEAPKPFFFSVSGALRSPHTTGTKRTPRLRSSVLNLSAFCIASVTVSFFPARIT